MNTAAYLWLSLIGLAILLVVFGFIFRYRLRFSTKADEIKEKIGSSDKMQRAVLNDELKVIAICCLTGFSVGKSKKLFARYKKVTGRDLSVAAVMAPSVIGMVLCGICLAGTTWAWFSAHPG